MNDTPQTPNLGGSEQGSSPGSGERDAIMEKAAELGRLISQTAEYRYLSSAQKEISDDRDATEMLNRVKELQDQVVSHVERGEEPPEDLLDERQELAEELQRSGNYQSLVSAQSNFDKLMKKVNRAIGRGMKKGEESSIIMPS